MHYLSALVLLMCGCLCSGDATGKVVNVSDVATQGPDLLAPTSVTNKVIASTHESVSVPAVKGEIIPAPPVHPTEPSSSHPDTTTSPIPVTTSTKSTSTSTTITPPSTTAKHVTTSVGPTEPTSTTSKTNSSPPPSPTTPAPNHHRHFDGPSFIGGMVLTVGLMGISFVAFKFYKARTEQNYHTL